MSATSKELPMPTVAFVFFDYRAYVDAQRALKGAGIAFTTRPDFPRDHGPARLYIDVPEADANAATDAINATFQD